MTTALSPSQMKDLIYGPAPENLSCLAFKILLGRLRLKAARDASQAQAAELMGDLADFLGKNAAIAARDLAALGASAPRAA